MGTTGPAVRIVLISTYELGRQPFGLASPAAWLRAQGHEVTCADLAVASLPAGEVREADMVALFLPMHTATRLAAPAIERVRALNRRAHLCCYGLYAPLNEPYLRSLGVETILGGEFEGPLAEAAARLERGEGPPQPGAAVSLDRQRFLVPDRTGLPPLARYAHLHVNGTRQRVGYTEASRGCKHLCRHCPVVPVYAGRFRIVQSDVVLEDIRRQAAAGAEHITFGDPDFFNGPSHAMRLVRELHREHPGLTYDVTIKIEHLRRHREYLPELKETGCLFVTSAVESIEDAVLEKLEKHHTRQDFIEVARDCRAAGLTLAPTFIPFTPWTTLAGYRALLELLVELDLVENVGPVQLGLRLLIPAGSRLLELLEIREVLGPFDQAALAYRWKHRDPALDRLSSEIFTRVAAGQKARRTRREIFGEVWELAHPDPLPEDFDLRPRATIPYMDEPWYC